MSLHSFRSVGWTYTADEDEHGLASFHEPRVEERRDDEKYFRIAHVARRLIY
ncbi:MAG: hypothetical protein OSB03_18710 [Vicinamibacterales bacterium]|nr:hypothetical protein [Vicinamibacterales bacterium]